MGEMDDMGEGMGEERRENSDILEIAKPFATS